MLLFMMHSPDPPDLGIISEIEIELISIYGTGDSESICKNLTKNELKQVFDIILACIDV